MYDNTKMIKAFKAWLENNVEIGFGEHYAGDLLLDFEQFLRETKMLRKTPGRVQFGKMLTEEGFGKRKRMGLTYYYGLELIDKPERDALEPKRYRKTKQAEEERERERIQVEREAEFDDSEEAHEARLAAFKAELETETQERVRKVGYDE